MKKNIKLYNESEHGSYAPIVELSPYAKIDKDRIINTKFIFKKCNEYIKKHFNNNVNTFLDIGCGNGELIYFLSKIWKNSKFTGIDITLEFLEVAKELNKSNKNIVFINEDIFNLKTNFPKSDVVCCTAVFQIFPEPDEILNKLIDFVEDKGVLIVSARFNSHDISAIIKYRDESKKESEDIWRCDFNIHSEKWISKIISKRKDVRSFRFEYPIMQDIITKKENAPHVNKWTIPNINGGYDIINGMHSIYNPSFLIVEKK